MAVWTLYVITVSALLGAAALCAERAARQRKSPTRWFWLVAILASIIVPAVISSVSVQVPIFIGTAARKIIVLRDITSIPLSPQQWISASNTQINHWRSFDQILKTAWLVSSTGMLLILIAHAVLLRRRRRNWHPAKLLDRSVLVSADVGPAVVGFLRPSIVLPAWVSDAPHQTQVAVIAHECGHVEANDPQLFTIALFLLVAVPWNLPLWWQLRRLRHAIEVDCDARVVRSGQDALAYSEALITVGERRSVYIGAVAAMSEPASLLHQRIKILLGKPARWWKISATALMCLSLVLVGAAAQVSPPNARPRAPHEAALDRATLQRYVGHYRIGDTRLLGVFTVTLSGTQLTTQMTGQRTVDVYPQTATQFFVKTFPADMDFITNDHAVATAVVLHQGGNDQTMPRMDDAVAGQFNADFEARIRSNSPQPGAEANVRDLFDRLQRRLPPDYSRMSPALAALARQQAASIEGTVVALGALESITFQGVAPDGASAYVAKFDKGALMVYVQLDSQGSITEWGMKPFP